MGQEQIRRPSLSVLARGRTLVCIGLGIGIFTYAGCSTVGFQPTSGQSLRVSEAVEQGDAARRASMRLVVQGLDADGEFQFRRAQGLSLIHI